ncbi:MAG: signal recognition particle-docking protein FtsY [Deltaproteobacteria bacterium]|nr:signal recognition particle-docking protein FtsY [Deltaproteobacteria bacterium]
MLFKKNREKAQEEKRQQEAIDQHEKELRDKLSEAEDEFRDSKGHLTKDIILEEDKKSGLFGKMKFGLKKTKKMFLGDLIGSPTDEPIDEEFIEDLEEQLLAADLGVSTTTKVIGILEKKWGDLDIQTQKEAIEELKRIIENIMSQGSKELPFASAGPTIYLFVGVNGVGKTTSIGKLAAMYKKQGKKVLVAAGDTFRAAAIEQLQQWAKRSEVDFISKAVNSDPSATIYEATSKAVYEDYNVLLCDTSGRLHTKKNLMEELKKIQRVIKKILPSAPHATFLVLDANTGQNAIIQTKEFKELIGLDGLIVTKLDGTAKGGVVIGIVNEFEVPIYFIGVGEGVEDLQSFDARAFAEALFDKSDNKSE